jgi:hypothetical protein
MRLHAELVVDGEPFTFTVDRGVVDVKAGKVTSPEATLTTSYEPMIAVADGQMSLDELSTRHMQLSGPNPAQAQALADLMGRAMMHMTEAAASSRP